MIETFQPLIAAARGLDLSDTDAAQREAALQKAREQIGAIDVLVNNAGWASFATVQKTPPADVDRMLALNFAAPIAMTRPRLRMAGMSAMYSEPKPMAVVNDVRPQARPTSRIPSRADSRGE